MSADIWLEDTHGERLDFGMEDAPLIRAHARTGNNEFNLTYNLTPMLRAAGMDPWKDFIGLSAQVAGRQWLHVLKTLNAYPTRFKAMNPENGWGSYDGAVEVLAALVDACIVYPDAVIGGWL